MLLGLFLAGTVWFWILLAAAALTMCVCIKQERFHAATFCLVATFAALGFLGDFNVLSWIRQNPALFAAGLVAYLVAGTVWSFAKWSFFVHAKRDKMLELKAVFLLNRKLVGSSIPGHLEAEWYGWLASNDACEGSRFRDSQGVPQPPRPPQADRYKGKITAWMFYWPPSFAATIIDDPLRKLFNFIFTAFQGIFQRISDHAYRDMKHDIVFSTVPAPPSDGNGDPAARPPLTAPTTTEVDASHGL